MQVQPNKTNTETDGMVRARVDTALKEQWEAWCARANITPSQGLRWIISMHLSDPSKLWEYLAAQDKKDTVADKTDSSSDGGGNV